MSRLSGSNKRENMKLRRKMWGGEWGRIEGERKRKI